jgi:hypothetical protein
MVRRWIIRVPFLLALAAVVGVWVGSYFGGLSIRVDYLGRMWVADAVQGQACFLSVPYEGLKPNVYLRFQRPKTASDWNIAVSFPGFRYSDYLGITRSHDLVFPVWFPTLLLAALGGFVWRKTRYKGPGRGFPVEPATDAAARPET